MYRNPVLTLHTNTQEPNLGSAGFAEKSWAEGPRAFLVLILRNLPVLFQIAQNDLQHV